MKNRRHYTLSGDIYTMGNDVPLLNDYKRQFFFKRFVQTILGPKLRVGYDAPAYVYLNQALLFILPWLVGGAFTLLVEYEVIYYDAGCYAFGALMCLYVLCAQITSYVVQKKCASVTPLANPQHNILSDDDEVDFEACCGVETFKFVVPVKRYKINILFHALISGLMCGAGLRYLSPLTLNTLYNSNTAQTVILFIFGWITLCVAQYPLTVGAPPELAVFRTLDNWEISPLMRPFYVGLLFAVDILHRHYTSSFVEVNSVLHVLFIFLPVLWSVGILPPLDALILWLMEQIHFTCFGGSQMASDLRLCILTVLSCAVLAAAYFITDGLGSILVMAIMGYLLSTDIGQLGAQLMQKCRKTKINSMKVLPIKGFLWKWTWREFLFHLFMGSVVGCVTSVLYTYRSYLGGTMSTSVLGYCVLALTVLDKLLGDMQRVYLAFGIFRNRMFPATIHNVAKFKRRKNFLSTFGWIRRILLDFFAPLVMLSYLCLSVSVVNSQLGSFWAVLGAVRAFRWIWQGTRHSLLEIFILVITELIGVNQTTWVSLGKGLQLLLIGLCRDRFVQLLNKFYVYAVIFLTPWTDRKQRRRSTVPIIVISIFLSPLIFGLMVVATAISAPLLPLFTLPVFLIGFPRPIRSWPEAVGASANVCADTMFYRQLAPELAKALRTGFANGSLGDPNPGSHYLIRYQDRLAWILVLERGYNYCTINIKGLELQETSCHTVEAARVDDIFCETFEHDKGVPSCAINHHLFNTLTPQDATLIDSYSDARNVLTGILDSPDNLHINASCFIRSLTWVFLHYALKKQSPSKTDVRAAMSDSIQSIESKSTKSKACDLVILTSKDDVQRVKPKNRLPPIKRPGGVGVLATVAVEKSSTKTATTAQELQSLPSIRNKNHDNDVGRLHHQETCLDKTTLEDIDNMLNDSWVSVRSSSSKPQSHPSNASRNIPSVPAVRPTSAVSIPGSIWSSDSDDGADYTMPKVNLVAGLSTRARDNKAHADQFMSPMMANRLTTAFDSDEDFDDKHANAFGMPAVDVTNRRSSGQMFGSTAYRNGNGIHKLGHNITSNLKFSEISSEYLLSNRWMEIPIEQSKLASLSNRYLKDWHRHVVGSMSVSAGGHIADHIVTHIQNDASYEKMFAQFVMACYAVIYELGSNITDPAVLGPSHVYKVYSGEVPWSIASEWITDDADLRRLVLKSYRLAVKMMIDQVLLGEVSSDDEFQEMLEEFESDWYLGSEKDEEWTEAILNGTPNLMSLGYNPIKAIFSSRTLSKQEVMIEIGSLNEELVRAQWANLTLELLYMTNDDEERYSIQAHPTLLRNLTVQAADPPLGYPIFSSEPITVPTL
ncbi:pecanex-like protein 4 [Tubulanus polymorphus]|uniref:pecanex-like protein 4 n=1 Tax=Tubulanus polymorphus TaxID=672921 RepID=UPI003DA6C5D9